jgi:hypothetical protein
VDSVFQDEEEEEIFFGSCSQKERSGAFAKYVPKLTASVVEPEPQEAQLFRFRIGSASNSEMTTFWETMLLLTLKGKILYRKFCNI